MTHELSILEEIQSVRNFFEPSLVLAAFRDYQAYTDSTKSDICFV